MDQNKVLDAGFQQVAEILSRWRSFRGHNPHRFCENGQWYKYISNLTDYILILNLFFLLLISDDVVRGILSAYC